MAEVVRFRTPMGDEITVKLVDHFMVSFDDHGNVASFHSSDSRHGSRFGENEIYKHLILCGL
jgi:hypothetical protein